MTVPPGGATGGKGQCKARMFEGMLSNAKTYSFYHLLSSHCMFVEESGVHSFPAPQVVVKKAGFCRVHKSFVGPRSPLGQYMSTSSDYHEKEKEIMTSMSYHFQHHAILTTLTGAW